MEITGTVRAALKTHILNPVPQTLPIVSIVSSFLGLPFRILRIELVNLKKELQWRL